MSTLKNISKHSIMQNDYKGLRLLLDCGTTLGVS